MLPRRGRGNAFPASSYKDATSSSRPRGTTPGAMGAMGSGQESHETPGEARGQGAGRWVLDEGGVQLARFMVIVGASLKELLDQGRFLLLQLGDAFALVSHLLHRTEEENAAQMRKTPASDAGMRTPVVNPALAGASWVPLPQQLCSQTPAAASASSRDLHCPSGILTQLSAGHSCMTGGA